MPRTRTIGIVVALAVVAVVALGWAFLRDTAPPVPTLDAATDRVQDDPSEPAASVTEEESPAALADLEGTWTIATDVGDDVDSGTFVGYRVDEELRGVGATTAFGRSPQVQGTLTVVGDAVTDVEVVVDMTALQSDSGRRDEALRTRGIESSRFPTASFTSTAPIPLPPGAAEGEPFAVEARGVLDLHGVAREVTVPLDVQLVDDHVVVVGTLEIAMADHDIVPPRVGPVLEIADVGTLELQLFLRRA